MNAAEFAANDAMAASLSSNEFYPIQVRRGSELEYSQAAFEQQYAWKNSVLVLVSKRFGLERIGPEYFKLIKKYMRLDSFRGIVGGKPRFAYYFVGHLEQARQAYDEQPDGFEMMPLDDEGLDPRLMQDDNGHDRLGESQAVQYDESDRLVFLDPHYVNPQVDLSKDITSQVNLFHCPQSTRSIHMQHLDPCLSFGFLLRSQEDFEQFSMEVERGIQEDGEHRIFFLKDDWLSISQSMHSIMSFKSSLCLR